MIRLAEAGIPSEALHFVFIGDPSTPDGIWNSTWKWPWRQRSAQV